VPAAASEPRLVYRKKIMSPEHLESAPSRRGVTLGGITSERLIQTAIGVVHARGHQSATLFEVAKAAGISVAEVEHHFESRAVLMMRVLEEILRAGGESGVTWPSADLPLAQRAQAFVQALWHAVYEPPRFLVAWGIYFGCASDPALREYIAQRRVAMGGILHDKFCIAFPEVAEAPDVHDFINVLAAALRGMGTARLFETSRRAYTGQLQMLAGLIVQRCGGTAADPPAASNAPAAPSSDPT
jgi:AcrR family transcriptional regulator